jgi:hypothetical protein
MLTPSLLCLKDIDGFVWSKTSRGCQLAVKRSSGPVVQFLGFIDKVGLRPQIDMAPKSSSGLLLILLSVHAGFKRPQRSSFSHEQGD